MSNTDLIKNPVRRGWAGARQRAITFDNPETQNEIKRQLKMINTDLITIQKLTRQIQRFKGRKLY